MTGPRRARPGEVGRGELGAYAAMHFGFALLGMLVSYYLTYFWTDVWQLPLGAITGIITVSRLFDGGIDPLIGHYMDSRQGKHGKYKGYLRYWVPPFCLVHVLVFTRMPFTGAGALVWCLAVYLLWSFCYSMVEGVGISLLGAMTVDSGQRKTVNTVKVAAAVSAVVVVSYGGMPLVNRLGGGDQSRGMVLAMGVFAAGALALQFPAAFVVRERNVNPQGAPGFRAALKSMVGSRSLVAMTVFYLLIQTNTALRAPMTVYYVNYYLGREDLFSLIASVGILCSLFSQPLILFLARRVETVRLMLWGVLGSAAALLLIGAAGRSIPLVVGGACLYGVSSAFPANLIYVHAADLADIHSAGEGASYGATVNALLGLGSRVGAALGGALSTAVLGLTGYVPQAEQSALALEGIRAAFLFLPAIFCLAALLVLNLGRAKN